MNHMLNRGFTLWEVLVAMLVAGILLGIGIPNFRDFQRNNRIAAAANELVTGALLARSEAVKRQVPVTLCASPNPTAANPVCSPTGAGANGGFIVWVDENGNEDANGSPIITDPTDGNAVFDAGEVLLRQTAAPGGTVLVFADSGYIAYGPNGFRRRAQGVANDPASNVLFCDERGNRPAAGEQSSARAVRIDATGRAQTLREVAEIATAVAAIPGAVCP